MNCVHVNRDNGGDDENDADADMLLLLLLMMMMMMMMMMNEDDDEDDDGDVADNYCQTRKYAAVDPHVDNDIDDNVLLAAVVGSD